MELNTDVADALVKYRADHQHYKAFASRIESLLVDLCASASAKVHFIESRAKSPDSLLAKIQRPEKAYSHPLAEVTDLVGARIVLYYQDDLKVVDELIKRELTIVEEVHSHLAEKYDPDRFGYLSMHYVVRLGPNRATLPEWRTFDGLVAEVQVRTVLQHAWAAVSHAMQYKREADVPTELKRKLFRLAGLFELADEEFMGIRDSGQDLAERARTIVREEPHNAPLDAATLEAYIIASPLWSGLMNDMIKLGYSFELPEGYDRSEDYVGEVVEFCMRIGISTLTQLDSILQLDHRQFLKDIAGQTGRAWFVTRSFALFLLLIGQDPKLYSVNDLVELGWSKSIAERVVEGAQRQVRAGSLLQP